MEDLISRQAAMAYPLSWEHYDKEHGDRKFISGVESYREYIEHLPSAEPEIIRCKDCRYGVDYYHEGDCYCSNPKWGLKYFGGSWEFYCADAERRGEEE